MMSGQRPTCKDLQMGHFRLHPSCCTSSLKIRDLRIRRRRFLARIGLKPGANGRITPPVVYYGFRHLPEIKDKSPVMDTTLPAISQLSRTPQALGLVVKFVSAHSPFSSFDFGPTVQTLLMQIETGCHLVAVRNDLICGYLGWMHTQESVARAWVEEGAPLKADSSGDAVVVTILTVQDKADIAPLIRAAREREPNASVYWKRYFSDGRPASGRKVQKRQ